MNPLPKNFSHDLFIDPIEIVLAVMHQNCFITFVSFGSLLEILIGSANNVAFDSNLMIENNLLFLRNINEANISLKC